jgi:hypothetical protein
MMSTSSQQLSPVRCFFSEIDARIANYSGDRDLKFRLLGNIVGFSTDIEWMETPEQEDVSWLVVKLDDGTALIQIVVTTKMIDQLKVKEGSLIECIAVVKKRSYDPHRIPSTVSLIGEQVAVIHDANAETLRWMELCYKQSNGVDEADDSQWLGYPTRRVTADDLFQIIEYQCEFETEDSPKSERKGVSTEHLEFCFNLSSDEVRKLLHELQVRSIFVLTVPTCLYSLSDRRFDIQEYPRIVLQVIIMAQL